MVLFLSLFMVLPEGRPGRAGRRRLCAGTGG